MSATIIIILASVSGLVLLAIFFASRYKKVKEQGFAIIINRYKNVEASFTGGFVWPVVNSFEFMDITRKKISIIRIGASEGDTEETEGLHCKDNIRADLKVDFYIGVNPNVEDVKKVANTFKPSQASDIEVLKEHFSPKFSEALKTACKKFDFVDLFEKRNEFRTEVINVIGEEMDGFKIYDVVIDKIEQTALEAHNKNNVLDSEGIEKIAQITSQRNVQTNVIRQDEETRIKEKDVSAVEERLQLDKAQKLAEAVNKREVDIINSQEKAMASTKREEFLLKEKEALIKREQEEGVLEEHKKLEIQVATLNNEKKLKVQAEEVSRAEELEKVETSKRVAEGNIQKDLVVEQGMKEVADVQSQRVEIERKIAKEEEETNNLRAFEKANREKKVQVTDAEAAAEAKQTEEITKAKAERLAAEEHSVRDKVNADAKLYNDIQQAEAISALADAKRKDISATGLAEVEVEKERSEAIRLIGEAEASKVENVGKAEAEAKEAVLKAAESGSTESREFDKWQRKIDMEEKVRLAQVESEKEVGIESAKSIGDSLANADITLFGGDEIASIKEAILGSKKLDARINSSEHLTKAAERYKDGDENLINDIKEVLQSSDVSTGDLSNVAIAQTLASNPDMFNKLKDLFGK